MMELCLIRLYLQKQLGIGSYRTAWLMGHKIRKAMIQHNDLYTLNGTVEADEIFIGGKQSLDERRKEGHRDRPHIILRDRVIKKLFRKRLGLQMYIIIHRPAPTSTRPLSRRFPEIRRNHLATAFVTFDNVQQIRPALHHFLAIFQMIGMIISAAHGIRLCVSKLTFDPVGGKKRPPFRLTWASSLVSFPET